MNEASADIEILGLQTSALISEPAADVHAHSVDGVDDEILWYAVVAGREPGVYFGMAEISANVSGVPQSCVVRFDTEEQAKVAFRKACGEGRVRTIIPTSTRVTLDRSLIAGKPELLAHPACPLSSYVGRYYALVVGREPGVYSGAENIVRYTAGVPGCVVKKFHSHADARSTFLNDLDSRNVVRADYFVTERVWDASDLVNM